MVWVAVVSMGMGLVRLFLWRRPKPYDHTRGSFDVFCVELAAELSLIIDHRPLCLLCLASALGSQRPNQACKAIIGNDPKRGTEERVG